MSAQNIAEPITKLVIPSKMTNEESMLVAGVVVAERNLAIAQAKLSIAHNKLKKYYAGIV